MHPFHCHLLKLHPRYHCQLASRKKCTTPMKWSLISSGEKQGHDIMFPNHLITHRRRPKKDLSYHRLPLFIGSSGLSDLSLSTKFVDSDRETRSIGCTSLKQVKTYLLSLSYQVNH
jgi:hypothetical protein